VVGVQRRRFLIQLGTVAAAAFVWRLVYVAFLTEQVTLDKYHQRANLLAQGHGFIHSAAQPVATAAHPPLFTLVLAGVSYLGGTSFLAHQVACCVLSTAAVVVIALIGRDLAGDRAGLLAGALAGLYPPLWSNDALIMSESLFTLMMALFLWSAYRFWLRPKLSSAVLLGAVTGLAGLTRSEAMVLAVVVAVPLIVTVKGLDRRGRVRATLAVLLAAVVVVAPWTIRNVETFKRPVFLSDDLDTLIAGANCPASYRGPGIGAWNINCQSESTAGIKTAGLDESQIRAIQRNKGVNYAVDHIGRWPIVVAARVGRVWNLFRPLQPSEYVGPRWLNWWSVLSFFILQPLALLGALRLRRRRQLVWPLLVQAVLVTAVAVLAYGLGRFRIEWDVAAVILGGVALSGLPGLGQSSRPGRNETSQPGAQAQHNEPRPPVTAKLS
jgi:4-amino-4-deoxy-L-arabinose transferase-like glycosyltransferase